MYVLKVGMDGTGKKIYKFIKYVFTRGRKHHLF